MSKDYTVRLSRLFFQVTLLITFNHSSFAIDSIFHNATTDIEWFGATPPSRRYPLHRRGWEKFSLYGGADRLGARLDNLSGFPLEKIDDVMANEILDAVRAHGVIVIPQQNLTRLAQVQFTQHLGEVVVLPPSLEGNDPEPGFPAIQRVSNFWNTLQGGGWKGPTQSFGGYWHSDGEFWVRPKHNLLSILHAPQHIPPTGGETAFADLRAARHTLSGPLRERAERAWLRASVRDIEDFRKGTEEDLGLFPTAYHAMLQTHALDKGELLYIGSPHMNVQGLETPEAGKELLHMLFAHATSPSFTYHHAWEAGDVVVWDNTQTLHRAMPYDNDGQNKRELFRTQARFVTIPHDKSKEQDNTKGKVLGKNC